jgi:ABC-type arginine transport system permease subunit
MMLSLPRQSPRESRLAFTLTLCLNAYESESAPVAWVALPRGRSNAAPPY